MSAPRVQLNERGDVILYDRSVIPADEVVDVLGEIVALIEERETRLLNETPDGVLVFTVKAELREPGGLRHVATLSFPEIELDWKFATISYEGFDRVRARVWHYWLHNKK